MAEGHHHKNPAAGWLVFFFICFGIVLLGIVVFFARAWQEQPDAPSSGSHHSMILNSEKDIA